jgi:MFS family permease
LSACTFASYAVLAVPVGAWLDRRTRRPFVLAGDLGRGLALASIPIAHALGLLTLTQLVVVALVVGAFSVVFDVAYQSWLPGLVDPEDLVAANDRLGATDSAGRLIGPGVAGLLVEGTETRVGVPGSVLFGVSATASADGAAPASYPRTRHSSSC